MKELRDRVFNNFFAEIESKGYAVVNQCVLIGSGGIFRQVNYTLTYDEIVEEALKRGIDVICEGNIVYKRRFNIE